MNKKVMVFGVFDGLHDGHVFFLNEAKKLGDELYVVVARDDYVKRFKGKNPKYNQDERIDKISDKFANFKVKLADEKEYSWQVIKENKPDIIALGYDQIKLAEALKKDLFNFDPKPEIYMIDDFEGEKIHSSLL